MTPSGRGAEADADADADSGARGAAHLGAPAGTDAEPDPDTRADVAAFEALTRALVGITLQSLAELDGQVSMPQFRLLLLLDGLGRVPSSRLASALGMVASSVTRLADRLEGAGLLTRGTDDRSRSIVTLEVTAAGRDLVARVVARRHRLLAAVLDRMPADRRAVGTAAATLFADLASDAATLGASGPLPL